MVINRPEHKRPVHRAKAQGPHGGMPRKPTRKAAKAKEDGLRFWQTTPDPATWAPEIKE
jgi:hypothetical protein